MPCALLVPPPWSCPLCPAHEAVLESVGDVRIHLRQCHTVKHLIRVVDTVIRTGVCNSPEDLLDDDDDALKTELQKPQKLANKIVKQPEDSSKAKTRKKSSKAAFQCPKCNKVLSSNGNLNKHLRRPFECEHCGQGFNQKRDYQFHKMQHHSKERPFACQICGKGFVYKHYLSEHMNYHSGDRKYQCQQCGQTYYSSSTLAKHMARHAGAAAKERPYPCHLCTKAFTVKVDLKAHIKFVHERTERDIEVPVFPPGSGKSSELPQKYVPIDSNQEQILTNDSKNLLPPKPSLRMLPECLPNKDENLTQKELDSQREIEEWMISEGVSIGPLAGTSNIPSTPSGSNMIGDANVMIQDDIVAPLYGSTEVETPDSQTLPPMPSIAPTITARKSTGI